MIVRGCWSGDAPSHVSSTSVRPSSSRSVHESPRLRSRGVCNPSFVHELVRLPMRCIRPRPDCLSFTRECARLRVASVMVKPLIVPFQAEGVEERAICSRRRVPSALESWANCAHACRAIATTPIRGQTGLISAFGTQTPRFVDRGDGQPLAGFGEVSTVVERIRCWASGSDASGSDASSARSATAQATATRAVRVRQRRKRRRRERQ